MFISLASPFLLGSVQQNHCAPGRPAKQAESVGSGSGDRGGFSALPGLHGYPRTKRNDLSDLPRA